MEIKEIFRVNYMKDRFEYVGLLRNEKRFNLDDEVFFAYKGNEIFRGTIVGVELLPIQNPEYKYKISIPEELVRQRMDQDKFYNGEDIDRVVLRCDSIFNTVEEAKQSALKNLDSMFRLQTEEINRYFDQFKED